MTDAAVDPLVAEAVKRVDLAWIAVDDRPATAVWCTWWNDSLVLVCGGSEQADPEPTAGDCRVLLRGDHNGLIVDLAVEVHVVPPRSPDWPAITTVLAGKRLNSVGDPVPRWTEESTVYRLTPLPGEPRHGAALPNGSTAAPVAATPAARPTRRPFRLHRVKRHH